MSLSLPLSCAQFSDTPREEVKCSCFNNCHIRMRSYFDLMFVAVYMRWKQNGGPIHENVNPQHCWRPKTPQCTFALWRLAFLFAFERSFRNPTRCYCPLKLSSQSLWDSGPESRRSSWTSIGRAPSLHRKSQSGEMESLLSDTHTSSNPSSREQSLDQPEYLQVPMLHPPDCNGTTFHLPDSCYDDTPLTAHYHSDQEEDIEEVNLWSFDIRLLNQFMLKSQGKCILMVSCFCCL